MGERHSIERVRIIFDILRGKMSLGTNYSVAAHLPKSSKLEGFLPSSSKLKAIGGFKPWIPLIFFGFRFFGFHFEYGLITDETYSRRQISTGTKLEVSHFIIFS